MSGEIYGCEVNRNPNVRHVTSESMSKLFSADSSSLLAQAVVDVDLKVGGGNFPFVFLVMEKLGFNCILGMDLLETAEAMIDIKTNILHLFGGLTSVAMT